MSNIILKTQKAQIDSLQQVIVIAIIIIMLFSLLTWYVTTQQSDRLPLENLLLEQSVRVITLPEWRCTEQNCLEKERLSLLGEDYATIFGRTRITIDILSEQQSERIVLYDQLPGNYKEQRSIKRFVQVKSQEQISPGILIVEGRR